MITRRSLLSSGFGLLAVWAAPVSSVQAQVETDPAAFVTHLANGAMQAMVAKGLSDQERAARFRTLFTTDVDLVEIGRRVLGRYWRLATPEQQQEFLRLFEDVVVLTWSTRFKDYGGDLRHTISGVIDDGERGVTVSSRVERERQAPISLQWRLKRIEGGFRVIDLVIEGTSMAVTFQSEYASVIRANGDRIEGLLSALRAKLAELHS